MMKAWLFWPSWLCKLALLVLLLLAVMAWDMVATTWNMISIKAARLWGWAHG